MKLSDLKLKILFAKQEIADYVQIAQRIAIFVCTALLSVSIWAGLPLAFLIFTSIEVNDDFESE